MDDLPVESKQITSAIYSTPYSFVSVSYNDAERQHERAWNVCHLSFIDEKYFAKVTDHNSGKANTEFLLKFPFLFIKPNYSKNDKIANTIVCNIPCTLFIIE